MAEYIVFAHNDAETRSIFYEILTNFGYKITTVPTHNDILEILKKERPDFIFLDPDISDIPAKTATDKIKAIDSNIEVIIPSCGRNRPELIRYILKIFKESYSPPSPQEEAKDRHSKISILVVDDETESVGLLKNYLSRKGYNVDTALSGEEAINKIKATKPDLMLLDIRMTGMDGVIVLKKIKEFDKSIIVIMTTGIADDAVINTSLQLGACSYLVKPFNLIKLETAILNAIWHKYL